MKTQNDKNKTEFIGMRIDKYLKSKLEKLAFRDDRPLSNYIIKILRKYTIEKEK